MRPEILFPLFSPVTKLSGVGPRIATSIEKLGGRHIIDLLWHLPHGMIDRRYTPKIANAKTGVVTTLTVSIDKHLPAKLRKLPYKVECSDETGKITLIFFHAKADYLQKILPKGEKRIVSGIIENYSDKIQMTHPDHIVELKDRSNIEIIEPIYPLSQGLSQKILNKIIKKAFSQIEELPEWLDKAYLKKKNWPSWNAALTKAHTPTSEIDFNPENKSYQRLAYDELLANQLALLLIRTHMRKQNGSPIIGTDTLKKKVLKALPFEPTNSQIEALHDITTNMSSEDRMHRLLQGDVGSGKTLVALLSMLHAVESGAQAAILAPTEILARQHLATIEPLAAEAGINIALLTGRDKGKHRAPIIKEIANGNVDIIIGTHAIFQESVSFKKLVFVVIDEQHRFGVHQRLALTSKGKNIDILVMTATPIPRTLTLTAYGDMEVSRLMEKPKGRLPIDTRTITVNRINENIQGVSRAVQKNH